MKNHLLYALMLISSIAFSQKYISNHTNFSVSKIQNSKTDNFSVVWDNSSKTISDNIFKIESKKTSFSCFAVGIKSENKNLDCIDYKIEYRIFVDNNWTDWRTGEFEYSDNQNTTNMFWSDLFFTPNQKLRNNIEFKIIVSDKSAITQVRLDAYNVLSDKKKYENINTNTIKNTKSCPELPSVIGRDVWLWPYYGTQSYTPTIITPDHIVIHHGATPDTYTDGEAVVRSYWNYHVNTLGWSDIGYNFLTDKYGNLYQGRKNSDITGQDVRGAHAGDANSDAIGINFLGNSDVTLPTAVQLDICSQFMAWWFSTRGGSPTGSGVMLTQNSGYLDIPMISGHRDVNIGGTTCPGDALYAEIPDLRTSTQAILDNCSSTVTTEITSANNWKTQDFTADFTDISTNSGIKERYYQIIDFAGDYWGANSDYGFFKDNFYILNPAWENFSGTWSIENNNLHQDDETNNNTILSAYVNQNNENSFLYSFTAKMGGTDLNRRAGLHFMCDTNSLENRGNSYFAYFRLDDAEVQIYKVENDVFDLKQSISFTFDADTYYDFKISFNKISGEILIFVDDVFQASWIDANPYQAGNYVSFRTGNSTIDVTEFQVYHSRTESETVTLGDSTKEIRYQNHNPTTFSAKVKSIAIDSLNIISAINYHNLFVDWTVPQDFSVFDGTSTDIDWFYDSSAISANWEASIDENSDIMNYEYCLATSVGDSNIIAWTNNATNTSFTETALSLNAGVTYYIGVRATNNAGLRTANFYSNGQTLSATGIAEIIDNEFVIYPNPTSNKMQITMNNEQYSDIKEISIYDIYGRTVEIPLGKWSAGGLITIDVSSLKSGIYFIRIGQHVERFVKN